MQPMKHAEQKTLAADNGMSDWFTSTSAAQELPPCQEESAPEFRKTKQTNHYFHKKTFREKQW